MIFQYADDTYLIVPDSNIQTISTELKHISERATRHNVKLDESKSKGIIISLQKIHLSVATYLT